MKSNETGGFPQGRGHWFLPLLRHKKWKEAGSQTLWPAAMSSVRKQICTSISQAEAGGTRKHPPHRAQVTVGGPLGLLLQQVGSPWCHEGKPPLLTQSEEGGPGGGVWKGCHPTLPASTSLVVLVTPRPTAGNHTDSSSASASCLWVCGASLYGSPGQPGWPDPPASGLLGIYAKRYLTHRSQHQGELLEAIAPGVSCCPLPSLPLSCPLSLYYIFNGEAFSRCREKAMEIPDQGQSGEFPPPGGPRPKDHCSGPGHHSRSWGREGGQACLTSSCLLGCLSQLPPCSPQ